METIYRTGLGLLLYDLNRKHPGMAEKEFYGHLKELDKVSPEEADEMLLSLSDRRWQRILKALNTSEERICLLLAVLLRVEPGVQSCFTHAYSREGPSLGLMLTFSRQSKDYEELYLTMREATERLRLFLPVLQYPDSVLEAEYRADERLLDYLCGGDRLPAELSRVAERQKKDAALPEIFGGTGERDALADCIKNGETFFSIRGLLGSGRRLLLSSAFQSAERTLFFYTPLTEKTGKSLPKNNEDFLLLRELLFEGEDNVGLGVMLSDGKEPEHSFLGFLKSIRERGIPVVLIGPPELDAVRIAKASYIRITDIKAPDVFRRKDLWTGYGKVYGLTGVKGFDPELFSNRYKMTAGEIRLSAERFSKECVRIDGESGERRLSDRLVAMVCSEVAPMRLKASLRHYTTPYDWKDIRLPEENVRILKSLCAQVKYRKKVLEDWNFGHRYPYGKSVSAIFCGKPGTGKTMAANIIANELGLPLYTVDLSQVVDKYIGESEKKLEEIFLAAEKTNVVLFFDEADAVFGKRSEVQDAKDRFANTEISYLLQRVEQYDGVVILSTNVKNNIDRAFLRRIRYVIVFEQPDEATRKLLWEDCFSDPSTQTVTKGIDKINSEALARELEITGGEIKNIALNAAFLAAEEGQPIGMHHILTAVDRDGVKMGNYMPYDGNTIYSQW